MATRLADNRDALAMTEAEADALFQKIAEATIEQTAVAADYERQIAAIKAKAAADNAQFEAIKAPLETSLSAYISVHAADRFKSPRQRTTEWGKYGLRSVTNLQVTDEIAALISVKAQGIPAVVTTEKLDKKVLAKAIADGKQITGVEIRTGELVRYDVAAPLLNKARSGQNK